MKNEEKMKVNKIKEKEKISNKCVNKNETKNNLEKERKHCLAKLFLTFILIARKMVRIPFLKMIQIPFLTVKE